MLEPMSKPEENRIIRNLAIACLEDINKLDKNGYNWIMTEGGFIAHYNRGGFIAHYGEGSMLGFDITSNKNSNTYCNRIKGDSDYEYYKQKTDMYARLCEILESKTGIPSASKCFVPPDIKDFISDEPEWKKTIMTHWTGIFGSGHFFGVGADSTQRAEDLTLACMAYNNMVVQSFGDNKVDDHDGLRKEFTFPSGNTGTISELVECYGGAGWDTFNRLSDRNGELGIFEEDEEEEVE
jgi:hypothetical protein